jgi:hypothetical protein
MKNPSPDDHRPPVRDATIAASGEGAAAAASSSLGHRRCLKRGGCIRCCTPNPCLETDVDTRLA